jgi:hypothetical protein
MQASHLPGGLLWPVIIFEIGSGLLTAVGYQTRVVAAALTVYCLLTALIFHTSLPDQVQNQRSSRISPWRVVSCSSHMWALDGSASMAGSRHLHCASFPEGRSIRHERFRDRTHLGASLDECDYKISQLGADGESPGRSARDLLVLRTQIYATAQGAHNESQVRTGVYKVMTILVFLR